MDGRDVSESSTAPKPKRPLFKKRKIKSDSRPEPTGNSDESSPFIGMDGEEEEEDGLDLFKRSKDFFSVFIKDRDDELAAERQALESTDGKRRKLSPLAKRGSAEPDLYDVSENEKERIRTRRDERPLTPPPTKKNKPLSPSAGRRDTDKGKATASPASLATPSRRAPARPAKGNSIVLSDSDDGYVPPATAKSRPASGDNDPATCPNRNKKRNINAHMEIDGDLEEVAPATGALEDEDGEFAHFVVAARERREKQQAARAAAAAESARGVKPVEDRTVQVFVTSRLPPPEMRPVIFKTVMRKPIKVLRDTVVAFSGSKGRPLTEEEAKGAFLVWKDRRLYGSSTLMSLGVVPDADGDFCRTGSGKVNDGVTVDGQLHFELFTEQIYAEWMQHLERQRHKELYQTLSDDEGEDGRKPAAIAREESPFREGKNADKIRIFLKAKNFDQVKASARADTEINELVAAFRNVRKVPTDKEILIMFDGDKLAESDTVGDAGIEDRDIVDVLIK